MMKPRHHSLFLAAAFCAFAPAALADQAAAAAAGVDLDVEYCESTGEQYIDTGVLGNPGLRVEAEIMWTDTNPADDQHILGSFDKPNNVARRCYAISMYPSRMAAFSFDSSFSYSSWFQYTIGKRYRIVSDFGASAQSLTIDNLDDTPVSSHSSADSYSAVNSGKTLYLFALGHGTADGGVKCMTKARVYWLKIYQNGTLVRDYRPARQGDVYGLWEDVNGTFCCSATETPFKTPVSPRTADGEPEFFAQWIESNGSTYIDTGVIGRPETKIEATFQWKRIADSRLVSVSKDFKYLHVASGPNGEMWFRAGGTTLTMADVAFVADTDYTVAYDIHASSQTYSVTGPFGTVTTNDTQTAVNTTPCTFYVFAQNLDGNWYGGNSKVRLYSMKIWQDGVLVRDFVPGIRDGEGCLYDRVNNKCHISFDGAITSAAGLIGPPAGAPTQPKYKLSYLGSEGNSYIDTSILGNPGLRVEAEIMWTDTSPADDQHILGSFDKPNNVSRRCYPISMTTSRMAFFCFDASSNHSSWYQYTIGRKYRVVSDLGASAQSLTVDSLDGTPVSHHSSTDSYSAVASGKTLYLFALGHGTREGGVACMTKARVYSMKIYQNGTLVRNYVPVIADNGGPYLFDKVTQSFHQGATSGFWDVGEVGDEFSPAFILVIR